MREDFDSVWSEWFGETESLATDIGAVIKIPRICKYQQHRSNVPADSPREYYKRCLGIPFLDSLLSQINERFSIENRVVQSLIGTCQAERSFSVLRRIKSHLRSTMTEEKLTGLTMMSIHHAECLLF